MQLWFNFNFLQCYLFHPKDNSSFHLDPKGISQGLNNPKIHILTHPSAAWLAVFAGRHRTWAVPRQAKQVRSRSEAWSLFLKPERLPAFNIPSKWKSKLQWDMNLRLLVSNHQNNKKWELARIWNKGTPLHLWGGSKLVQPLWKAVWGYKKSTWNCHMIQQFKLLGFVDKENKSNSPQKTASHHHSALFTIAKIWK